MTWNRVVTDLCWLKRRYGGLKSGFGIVVNLDDVVFEGTQFVNSAAAPEPLDAGRAEEFQYLTDTVTVHGVVVSGVVFEPVVGPTLRVLRHAQIGQTAEFQQSPSGVVQFLFSAVDSFHYIGRQVLL